MAFMACGMVKKEENELATCLISHRLHEKYCVTTCTLVHNAMLILTLVVLTDIHQMKNLFWNRNMKILPSLFNDRDWPSMRVDLSWLPAFLLQAIDMVLEDDLFTTLGCLVGKSWTTLTRLAELSWTPGGSFHWQILSRVELLLVHFLLVIVTLLVLQQDNHVIHHWWSCSCWPSCHWTQMRSNPGGHWCDWGQGQWQNPWWGFVCLPPEFAEEKQRAPRIAQCHLVACVPLSIPLTQANGACCQTKQPDRGLQTKQKLVR